MKPGFVFPPVTVETPHDALMWVDRGLSRAARATGPRVLHDILTNSGEIIISGAFEGVKTACIAAAFITKGCERWLDQPTGHAPTFKSIWSLEWNRSCQHEISAWDKHMTDDSCCFGDILDFTPKKYRKLVGLDGGKELHSKKMGEKLCKCHVKTHEWCHVHSKMCRIKSADIHVAGSPCTDHSTFGCGKKFKGHKAKFFYI